MKFALNAHPSSNARLNDDMRKSIIPCMAHPIYDSKELNMHVRSVTIVAIELEEPKSLRVPPYTFKT